jgi:hypothetical protein
VPGNKDTFDAEIDPIDQMREVDAPVLLLLVDVEFE